MSTYRGLDGFLATGGALTATPNAKLNGALAAGAGSMNINATTLLAGVVAPGDKFTIAGEAGSPVHTVTGSAFLVAAGNALAGIPFTPAIAAGGVASGAAVTFQSNSLAQVTVHSLSASQQVIDGTAMGDAWETKVGGAASWQGSGTVQLDLGDPVQKALADRILAATPSTAIPCSLFGLQGSSTTRKQLYGAAILSGFEIVADKNDLVIARMTLTGSGPLAFVWV